MRIRAVVTLIGLLGAVACTKEAGNPEPDSSAQDSIVQSVVGYWTGDWGEMILSEASDGRITGVYVLADGVVTGAIEGDTFIGRWCQTPYEGDRAMGPVEFTFENLESAPTIDGRWKYDADSEDFTWREDWDLKRATTEPPAELVARANNVTEQCR